MKKNKKTTLSTPPTLEAQTTKMVQNLVQEAYNRGFQDGLQHVRSLLGGTPGPVGASLPAIPAILGPTSPGAGKSATQAAIEAETYRAQVPEKIVTSPLGPIKATPKYQAPPTTCEACGGAGQRTVTGISTMTGRPTATPGQCPDCKGTGNKV